MANDKASLPERFRLFDRAIWRKGNKFIWSGLGIALLGLVIVALGLTVTRNAYSTEALIVGAGIIILVIGIIRALIGVINPIAPTDVVIKEDQEEVLQRELFQQEVQEERA